MKKGLIIIIILFTVSSIYAQNASTYFPGSTGYKWYYKNIPLDTNNTPITSLTNYRIDSFAVVANYKGLLASIVLTKDNLINFNQNAPYTDSNFYNFQSTNAWKYFIPYQFPDTFPIFGTTSFLEFVNSFKSWYNFYRFAQTVNAEYTIFAKDTTIQIDTFTLPLRINMKAKRLNDEVVVTVNGPYNTKKFVSIFGISYMIILPPPLPSIEVPIVQRPDTVWIAQNIWMVKEVIPSINISLSQIGIFMNIPIPGKIILLENPSINVKKISSIIPETFQLEQNYPNPFNQNTIINYNLPESGNVKLVLFDLLGRQISTLIDEYASPGKYEYRLDASNLSSGVYYYKLYLNNKMQVKKMVVTK